MSTEVGVQYAVIFVIRIYLVVIFVLAQLSFGYSVLGDDNVLAKSLTKRTLLVFIVSSHSKSALQTEFLMFALTYRD